MPTHIDADDIIPPVAVVRERLAVNIREQRYLRRLHKLAFDVALERKERPDLFAPRQLPERREGAHA